MRLAITWSDYEPTAPVDGVHHWDQARLADLDAEIAFFREHGIQVLLDLHQYGWSPYFAVAAAVAAAPTASRAGSTTAAASR